MSKNLRGLSGRRGPINGLYEEIVRAVTSDSEGRDGRLETLSEEFLTGASSVLGASSFYDFLHSSHLGKKAFVCDGTACLTSGRQAEVKKILLTKYNEAEIGTVSCLGHCHTNDACMINGKVVTAGSDKLSGSLRTDTNVDKPALLLPTGDLDDYYSLAGRYVTEAAAALKELETSGLRGRGGAGFPYYIKVLSSRDAHSSQKYIVCNADEGDPGAYSDKWLLEERPHSVLFGMLVTGLITGADTGVVYIRGEYPLAVNNVRKAVEKIEDAGIITGLNHDTGLRFRFHVVEGSGAYICGEETSLLNSLEGLRPEVRTRPPFPALYGLFGRPTVLSNVETFANIHYILKEGGAAYAALGTEKSSGTKLVSLDGAFNRPALLEVRMGTPLKTIIGEMGGGTRYPVKAFQIGGPLGGLVPASKINDLTLDFESFSREGFLLGHASIVSVPEDFPIIKFLEHLFDFTKKESCGKCFPCRLGSARGLELVSDAAERGEKIDRILFNDLLETMQTASLCALGGGLPLPVNNAMKWFNAELEDYFIPVKD